MKAGFWKLEGIRRGLDEVSRALYLGK